MVQLLQVLVLLVVGILLLNHLDQPMRALFHFLKNNFSSPAENCDTLKFGQILHGSCPGLLACWYQTHPVPYYHVFLINY